MSGTKYSVGALGWNGHVILDKIVEHHPELDGKKYSKLYNVLKQFLITNKGVYKFHSTSKKDILYELLEKWTKWIKTKRLSKEDLTYYLKTGNYYLKDGLLKCWIHLAPINEQRYGDEDRLSGKKSKKIKKRSKQRFKPTLINN